MNLIMNFEDNSKKPIVNTAKPKSTSNNLNNTPQDEEQIKMRLSEHIIQSLTEKYENFIVDRNIPIKEEVFSQLKYLDPLNLNYDTFLRTVEENVLKKFGYNIYKTTYNNNIKVITPNINNQRSYNNLNNPNNLNIYNNLENSNDNMKPSRGIIKENIKNIINYDEGNNFYHLTNHSQNNNLNSNYNQNINTNYNSSPFPKKVDLNSINYSRFNYAPVNPQETTNNNNNRENVNILSNSASENIIGINKLDYENRQNKQQLTNNAGNNSNNNTNTNMYDYSKHDEDIKKKFYHIDNRYDDYSRNKEQFVGRRLGNQRQNSNNNSFNNINPNLNVNVSQENPFNPLNKNTINSSHSHTPFQHLHHQYQTNEDYNPPPIDEILVQVKNVDPLTREELLKKNHIIKTFENKQKQAEDWSIIAKYNHQKFEEEEKKRKLIEHEKQRLMKEYLNRQITEKQDVERIKKEQMQKLILETREGFQNVLDPNKLLKNLNNNGNGFNIKDNFNNEAEKKVMRKELLNDERKIFQENIERIKREKLEDIKKQQHYKDLKQECNSLILKQIEEKNRRQQETYENNLRYGKNLLKSVSEYQHEAQEKLRKEREKIFMYKESLDQQLIDKRQPHEQFKDNQIKLMNKSVINEIYNYYQ